MIKFFFCRVDKRQNVNGFSKSFKVLLHPSFNRKWSSWTDARRACVALHVRGPHVLAVILPSSQLKSYNFLQCPKNCCFTVGLQGSCIGQLNKKENSSSPCDESWQPMDVSYLSSSSVISVALSSSSNETLTICIFIWNLISTSTLSRLTLIWLKSSLLFVARVDLFLKASTSVEVEREICYSVFTLISSKVEWASNVASEYLNAIITQQASFQ